MTYPKSSYEIRFWDVEPKLIRGLRTHEEEDDQQVQLHLVGEPGDDMMFVSQDPEVAVVSGSGLVTLGMQVGHTVIEVYEGEFPEHRRHVEVVVSTNWGQDIQPIGDESEAGEDTGRFALEGHVHEGVTQFGTNIQSVGTSNSAGTADEAARVDHVHAGTTQLGNNIQSVGTSNAAGSSASAAREDHVHQGVKEVGGNVQSVGTSNAAGSSAKAAREDHVHQGVKEVGSNIKDVGTSNQAGTSAKAAREDHVHRLTGAIVWQEYTGA